MSKQKGVIIAVLFFVSINALIFLLGFVTAWIGLKLGAPERIFAFIASLIGSVALYIKFSREKQSFVVQDPADQSVYVNQGRRF